MISQRVQISTREIVRKIPILGRITYQIYRRLPARYKKPGPFPGSQKYWERRYCEKGDSGVGSYGKFAEFKAEIINAFVDKHSVRSVIDFGCGDGNQLILAKYPKYLGFDVSKTAISKCQKTFASDTTKSFSLMSKYKGERADVTLSLDVIYHLVEDKVFEHYMRTLFDASERYVIIYSSDYNNNRNDNEITYLKHRNFTTWIKMNLPNWKLIEHLPNKYPYQGDYTQGSFLTFLSTRKTPAI